MSTRDRLNQLLNAISTLDLSLGDKDSCQLKCANGLTCVIELLMNSSNAFAYIPVTRLPNADRSRSALMQEALSINLQLQQEDLLSIVYDKRIDHITLCTQCDVHEVTVDEFDQWLGNLIQKSEYVRSKLIEAGLQASLNKTQEERRTAMIARQEHRQQQRKEAKRSATTAASQPTPKQPAKAPLGQVMSNIHLVKM